MTQLEFSTSPPTYCWVCGKTRPVDLSGCGPQCEGAAMSEGLTRTEKLALSLTTPAFGYTPQYKPGEFPRQIPLHSTLTKACAVMWQTAMAGEQATVVQVAEALDLTLSEKETRWAQFVYDTGVGLRERMPEWSLPGDLFDISAWTEDSDA